MDIIRVGQQRVILGFRILSRARWRLSGYVGRRFLIMLLNYFEKQTDFEFELSEMS